MLCAGNEEGIMGTKLVVLAVLLIGGFAAFRLFMGAATAHARARDRELLARKQAETMVACPQCGAYAPCGQGCSCGNNPTP